MKGKDALLAVLAALEQLEVPYMVTGSFATNVYSIPRSTKDADVIVAGSACFRRLLHSFQRRRMSSCRS